MAQGALSGIRIIDLSRVLAGPVCTQMLGDMGADVIKIERPGTGDDTRMWGPPFLKDDAGNNTSESAYYLSANRNKQSLSLDLTRSEDLAKLHALLEGADVLVENFRLGSLEKLGLGYEQLRHKYPRLVYCSITGFGQYGPLAHEPGYDFMVQGLSGFMANTGPIEGPPTKAGVAIVDYVTGQNAAIGILAALQARQTTGSGQLVDIALFDSALAMMTNLAQYTLTSGQDPKRVGNAHTTIVPYNAFEASDGWIILAVGNDGQFKRFAEFAGHPEWAADDRFKTNASRVQNRDTLTALIADCIKAHNSAHWATNLPALDVPCGTINTMKQALEHPQAKARGMVIEMEHKLASQPVRLVGNPVKLSQTPASYRMAPPVNGQDNAFFETPPENGN